MNKLFMLIAISLLFLGCALHVTPEETYLEPLPVTIVMGVPVVIAPPPRLVVRPLPPIIFRPKRPLYFYGNIYYYHFGGEWYYGKHKRGPWHKLPKRHYPSRSKHKRSP